jgi:hypothetical protein
MSDEFDPNPENRYSSFWPLLILVTGLFIWFGYQVYVTNIQRTVYDQQLQAVGPTLTEAQNVSTKYKALVSDLYQTAQKNQAAAQIVKDAIQAGMLRVQQNPTNSTTTPTPPSN